MIEEKYIESTFSFVEHTFKFWKDFYESSISADFLRESIKTLGIETVTGYLVFSFVIVLFFLFLISILIKRKKSKKREFDIPDNLYGPSKKYKNKPHEDEVLLFNEGELSKFYGFVPLSRKKSDINNTRPFVEFMRVIFENGMDPLFSYISLKENNDSFLKSIYDSDPELFEKLISGTVSGYYDENEDWVDLAIFFLDMKKVANGEINLRDIHKTMKERSALMNKTE